MPLRNLLALLFTLTTVIARSQTAAPPPVEQVAKLKSAAPLPYKVLPNWAQLPKGYNFGECSGVDIDKRGNVWVFNRGHWPIFEFDRFGKMLQAWSEDTFRVKSAHGIRVSPDGNLWAVDVDGHARPSKPQTL